MSVSRLKLHQIMASAPDADRMADLFVEWYERLPLPTSKKLMPLAHNWIFDHAFMEDWLGYEHMQHFFHGHYRDLMTVTLYENDRSAYHAEQYRYPKHSLGYLCKILGVDNPSPHDALADCVATGAAYKRVVLGGVIPSYV